MNTFFLDEHKDTGSWKGVWSPICEVIRRCLEGLHGFRFDPDSPFRIYCHSNRRLRPQGSLFFMQMHLPRLYSLDTAGWGVEHSRRATPEFKMIRDEVPTKTCRLLAADWLKRGVSKGRQPKPATIDLDGYLFVPLQRPDDCVIRDHTPISVEGFLAGIAAWADATRTRCVIKAHPSCSPEEYPETWEVIRAATQSPYVLLRSDNIHSLLERSSGVFTLNSGVGFEAIVHGRPVVAFGEADYSHVVGKGRIDDLEAAREYTRQHPDRLLAQKFAIYYIQNYCYWLGVDGLAEARIATYLSEAIQRRVWET